MLHFVSQNHAFASIREGAKKNIEAVMDVICQACTFKSVESVVESWISTLEHHSSKQHKLTEDSIHTQMMIACNGPPVQHSKAIVEDAMKRYWAKCVNSKNFDGHFIRRSERIKPYLVSKSIDALRAKKCKNPIML